MPAYFQFIKTRRPDRLAKLGGRLFGVSGTNSADVFIDKFGAWISQLGMTKRLSDYGITEDHFGKIAEDVARLYGPGDGTLPGDEIGPFTKSDIVRILAESC